MLLITFIIGISHSSISNTRGLFFDGLHTFNKALRQYPGEVSSKSSQTDAFNLEASTNVTLDLPIPDVPVINTVIELLNPFLQLYSLIYDMLNTLKLNIRCKRVIKINICIFIF